MKQSIAILLVDDHAMLREVLGARLAAEPDMEVLGAAGDADEAVEAVIRLHPDVVLMDIDMPGLICFEAARVIGATSPKTAVVFLSAYFDDRYIEQALASGAAGYVTKSEPTDALINAIRAAASGAAYYSPEVASRIVADEDGLRLGPTSRTRAATLTRREVEVLSYLVRGMCSKDIARTTRLSVRTVDNKVNLLMRKLDMHNRLELVSFAIREGVTRA